MTKSPKLRRSGLLAASGLIALLPGCVTVNAPEKPIEINLNVRIEQEVLVRLQREVEQLIQESPEAFPQRPPQPGTRR